MTEKIKIPFNDVFFYGVSMKSRDAQDVRTDIFANILMRYLRTLKPVSSKLYRTSEGNKFEYSYSFIPTKPLNWRVIKNRRIVEDIEQLSDGKYCLNYYDDQGRDSKRVLFNRQHKWQKTNYYNSITGSDLFCSIVPKEKNGETVILQYVTGETYPITLYCCPAASCTQVLSNVLERVPEPEATALTNYGVLYFAQEETLNIYKQVLKEEEEKYALLHKPEIYTTEEDVAGGFCFDVSAFDSTKGVGSMFDLSEAQELSEEDFAASDITTVPVSVDVSENVATTSVDFAAASQEALVAQLTESPDAYSLEADISDAIRIISDATDVHIDESVVFSQPQTDSSASEFFLDSAPDTADASVFDSKDSSNIDETEKEEQVESIFLNEQSVSSIDAFVITGDISAHDSEAEEMKVSDKQTEPDAGNSEVETSDDVDLLSMNDEDIDDYVKTLIDSLLLDAKTVAELKDSADDAFAAGGAELVADTQEVVQGTAQELVSANTPDSVISSNGAEYFYYGETDDKGRRSGRGKTLMASGKTAYEGEYKADERHGIGSFYYKDGSLCYWGGWSNNLRNGFGVGVSSETGTVHIGTWHNNKPKNIGVRFDKDGNFMYVDSACQKTNGGIRITGFTENSFTVEYWDENTLRTVKKEISLDDLNN